MKEVYKKGIANQLDLWSCVDRDRLDDLIVKLPRALRCRAGQIESAVAWASAAAMWSPDGRRIAFLKMNNDDWQLWERPSLEPQNARYRFTGGLRRMRAGGKGLERVAAGGMCVVGP